MLRDSLRLINFPHNNQREENKEERGKHGEREQGKQKEERNKSQPIFPNTYVVDLSESSSRRKKAFSKSVVF